jgi:hypothetical protein
MNNDIRNLLIVLGLGTGFVFLLTYKKKPKESKEQKIEASNKFAIPQVEVETTASKQKKIDQENAIVALKAMRQAIDAGECENDLQEITTECSKELNIKVVFNKKTKLLKALNSKGIVIAEEE